jgi:two-component system sensor histidine kinase RegB
MQSVANTRTLRAVSLAAAAGTRRPGAADRWLIGLRWIAIGGMLVTTLIAKRFVPDLRVDALWLVLVAVAAVNVLWSIIVFGTRRAAENLVTAQLVGDLINLGAMLWFSGGLTNPFAPFLLFQIALAGLVGARSSVVRVTIVAFAISVVISFAPPLPLASATLRPDLLMRLAHYVAITGLAGFLGASVWTYRRRIEELDTERERNERLVLLGRMAGGMAHELNTPLATILLASQELAAAAQSLGDHEVAQLGGTVASEAKRASQIIDLLRGRVREGGQRSVVRLTDAIASVADRVALERGFRGRFELRLERAPAVRVARAALEHLLTNVVTNAVQACAVRDDAVIEIAAEPERDGGVSIRVEDNGPGIRPSLLPRLGEPFQTTKEAQGGMGLGLYVCSVLARQMGGELEVATADGEGTRVTLRLPPPRPPIDAAPALDDDDRAGGESEAEDDATD